MVFLAIITGVLSFLNYFLQANYPSGMTLTLGLIAQIVLTVLTGAAMFGYRGKRSRLSYDGARYKIWTVRFSVIILSLLGSISVLTVLILYMGGIIESL